jgi:cytochrome c peroxidase
MKSRWLLLSFFALLLAACSNQPQPEPDKKATAPSPATTPFNLQRVALPEMPTPADNPLTAEKVALGKQLFFDTRLSKNGNMSCETCHQPDKGWTDGKALSEKFDGTVNTRHTPTLYNVGYYREWYWDGRAATLEAQILAAWKSQMGADPEQIAGALNGIEGYKNAFQTALGGPATPDGVTKALGSFVRTLISDNSPWDRYEKGDKTAVPEDAVKGFTVFSDSDKANCTLCHLPPTYTDALFHNVGVGFDKPTPDLGRGKFLADKATQAGGDVAEAKKLDGAFKTPTVRSVSESGPYFHDGRAATLEDAVDFMLRGGIKNPNLDEKLKPRKLTAPERTQLLAFLKSLTPEPKPFEKPQLP